MKFELLGQLTVSRNGSGAPQSDDGVIPAQAGIALPKSRKARALLAFLAMAPRPVTRSRLCELLWDNPSDPRGELRWCLSRLRAVLDTPDHQLFRTHGETLAVDLARCDVDVFEISRAMDNTSVQLELPQLEQLLGYFKGEFLDGLLLDDSPHFNQWVESERRRFRDAHVALLAQLVARLPPESDDVLRALERWLTLAPFERIAHQQLLDALARRGRLREADAHLAQTIRLFELEGLEWLSIREAWRAARSRVQQLPRIETPATEQIIVTPTTMKKDSSHRASICVMPFIDRTGIEPARASLGDGLADDIITRLAKLRALFVIARATVFSLADRSVGAEEAARILGVDYVASGSFRRRNGRLSVAVELAETQNMRIIWADEIEYPEHDAFVALDEIGNRIVASIAEEVESTERNRALLKPPASLDAWESYHRGLWHMYRFNGTDNERAEHFFTQALQLDPTFSRAYSGLSFAHFQNAFLHKPNERQLQTDRAFESAGQSIMADDRDPAAHCAMGRALWLRGLESESLSELALSVDLSPNFALGHYTVGFVHSQSGNAQIAIDAAERSRRLSPFDPLLFAMLATNALAHLRLGQFEAAASWALKAAARPNAHAHVMAIAMHCLAAAGRMHEARNIAQSIHKQLPQYGFDDFIAAFRFSPQAVEIFKGAAGRIGFA
jgi:DNA-binding SARP family transcriptional activator